MTLVEIARIGTDLVAHAFDRAGVERPDVTARPAGPPRLDRLRSSLFQRGVVHEGVRPRVEDVVAERGRLRCVAGDAGHLASMNPVEHALQLRQIHGLFEAVANRLVYQRVIGDLAIARNVLQARGRIRKDRSHEIVRLHALELRRHLAPAAIPRHGERDRRVPAPPGLKDRRIQKRLHQDVAHARRVQVAEHISERERVLRSERQQQRIFGRRGLKLEVELTAESLAQRQRPGAVHSTAEWCVQHELHATGLVEKPLEDERRLRWHDTQHAATVGDVVNRLLGALTAQPGLFDQPIDWSAFAFARARAGYGETRLGREPRVDTSPQLRDGEGQLVAARRRFAEPERNRRRRTLRVADPHGASDYLQDLPRGIAKLKDVAGDALDREVLVHRANERILGLEHDTIVSDLGDRPTRHQRQQTRSASSAQRPVDLVSMHERRSPAPRRRKSIRDHRDDGVEVGARERPVRPRALSEREELILRTAVA